MEEKLKAFERVLKIMDELREKCPWDRKQTMESLRHLSIEELYELSDAILNKDFDAIRNELGDMILHIVFYAKIASEQGKFDIADVMDSLSEKLIQRHPHIYGDVKVQDEDEVKRNWEKIKLRKSGSTVLGGVPTGLPAMVKAFRIQEKAKGVGFEWEKREDVWEKVVEELREFHHEVNSSADITKLEDEFGDLLFSLINYARFMKINPEDALEKTNRKFISRFAFIEEEARSQGRELSEMTLNEMDQIWEHAKKQK
jgi:XTP/dITP diphosphohydrolase